jgi:hypothetical protein
MPVAWQAFLALLCESALRFASALAECGNYDAGSGWTR